MPADGSQGDGNFNKRVHFALQNGRHKVIMCDPMRLANERVPWRWVDDWTFVTCPHCTAAHEEASAELKADIQDRMNRKGFAHRDD